MIESVLSQGDTLPEQFERVLLAFLVFCNLPIDVFKIQVELQLHDTTCTYNAALQLWRTLWSVLHCGFQ